MIAKKSVILDHVGGDEMASSMSTNKMTDTSSNSGDIAQKLK